METKVISLDKTMESQIENLDRIMKYVQQQDCVIRYSAIDDAWVWFKEDERDNPAAHNGPFLTFLDAAIDMIES